MRQEKGREKGGDEGFQGADLMRRSSCPSCRRRWSTGLRYSAREICGESMCDGWEMCCDHDRIWSCAFGSQALRGFDLE
jgi:hypothetical protein